MKLAKNSSPAAECVAGSNLVLRSTLAMTSGNGHDPNVRLALSGHHTDDAGSDAHPAGSWPVC
jgi:hypothetical protein